MERDRARMLQGMGLSGAEGGFAGAKDSSSFLFFLTLCDADEAMSTSSRMSPSRGKEREWWSAGLEGEVEKLEVEGCFSGAEGGSMDPEGKVSTRK